MTQFWNKWTSPNPIDFKYITLRCSRGCLFLQRACQLHGNSLLDFQQVWRIYSWPENLICTPLRPGHSSLLNLSKSHFKATHSRNCKPKSRNIPVCTMDLIQKEFLRHLFTIFTFFFRVIGSCNKKKHILADFYSLHIHVLPYIRTANTSHLSAHRLPWLIKESGTEIICVCRMRTTRCLSIMTERHGIIHSTRALLE